MSMYSDDDYEQAMELIAKLADPPNGFKDITLDDAVTRLKKILDIAEGADLGFYLAELQEDEPEEEEEEG